MSSKTLNIITLVCCVLVAITSILSLILKTEDVLFKVAMLLWSISTGTNSIVKLTRKEKDDGETL